jgi:hypothetical protein
MTEFPNFEEGTTVRLRGRGKFWNANISYVVQLSTSVVSTVKQNNSMKQTSKKYSFHLFIELAAT